MSGQSFLKGSGILAAGAFLCAAALGTGDATAQPLRVAGLTFSPVLELSTGFDSNLFESDTDPKGTLVTSIRPSLSVESNFSRHRIAASVGLRQDFFAQSPQDNTQTFFLRTESIADLNRRLRVQSTVGYRRLAEQRGSDNVGVTNVSGPVYSDHYDATLRVQYLPGDFRIEPFVGATYQDFMDRGQVVDQDDRDRARLAAGLEVGYRIVRGYEGFARGTYFDVNYLDPVDSDGFDRDSNGLSLLAGVNLKLSRLLNGSAAVGVVFSDFEDPAFQSTTDFTAQIGLDWNPRRRWRFSLNGSRELEQTNVAGASDSVQTRLTLGANYEVIRGLNGFLRLGFVRDEFNSTDRTDTGFLIGSGLDWSVTRQINLRLAYNFQHETSTAAGAEFTKHLVNLGLRYGL